MTDDIETETDEYIDEETEAEELTERDFVTLKIPLDPMHKRGDLALREQGVEVEAILSQEVAPTAEQKLYAILQQVKYAE